MKTGGTETMLIDIANRQLAEGDTPVVLLINEGQDASLLDTLDERIERVFLHRPTGSKNPLWLLRYARALCRLNPDIVHMHNPRALGMLYGPRKYKVVCTYHCCGDPNPWAARADAMCAISRAVADDAAGRDNCRPEIIYNGTDTSRIGRRHAGGLSAHPRLIQIGSLNHNIKGQHITLQALARMRHCDATVDFFGDGASRPMLEAMAGELGLTDRVTFHGIVSRRELYQALPTFDVALLPSLNEGFGLALTEPMAARVPVVASDLPGPMEILRADGRVYGSTCRPGDADSLADAIDAILDDYDAALDTAAAATDRVLGHFDISATVAAYRKLYDNLIQQH